MRRYLALMLMVFSFSGCTIMDQAMSYVQDQGREWVNDPVKVAEGRAKFIVKAGEAYDAAIEKARAMLNEEEEAVAFPQDPATDTRNVGGTVEVQ